MVKAGLGAAISINEILSDDIGLVFRPFALTLKSDIYLAWKKSTPPTPATAALIKAINDDHL